MFFAVLLLKYLLQMRGTKSGVSNFINFIMTAAAAYIVTGSTADTGISG